MASENHDKSNMTVLLQEWRSGDKQAQERLTPMVYNTLKRIANNQIRKESAGHTLQATVLVNDAFMELLDDDISWNDSAHFKALSATIMRRTLIDHARSKQRQKRGGNESPVTLLEGNIADESNQFDVLELDQLLEKMAILDERQAKVVELTFFGGLTYEEIAEVLAISKATVDRELRVGKAWLKQQISN